MKRYLVFIWFIVRVISAASFWSAPLLTGVLFLVINKRVGFNILLVTDRALATWIFGTRDRTISGVSGERAYDGRKGYKLIAGLIDWLAVLFGDAPDH